jgi:hypothetical protein
VVTNVPLNVTARPWLRIVDPILSFLGWVSREKHGGASPKYSLGCGYPLQPKKLRDENFGTSAGERLADRPRPLMESPDVPSRCGFGLLGRRFARRGQNAASCSHWRARIAALRDARYCDGSSYQRTWWSNIHYSATKSERCSWASQENSHAEARRRRVKGEGRSKIWRG